MWFVNLINTAILSNTVYFWLALYFAPIRLLVILTILFVASLAVRSAVKKAVRSSYPEWSTGAGLPTFRF
jgi:hypothetical protein